MKGHELKGIVSIELGGDTFNLCFDMNAICLFEEKYGDIQEIFKLKSNVSTIRFLLFIALQHSHEDKFTNEKQVGKLFSLRDVQFIMPKIMESIKLALPEVSETTEKK